MTDDFATPTVQNLQAAAWHAVLVVLFVSGLFYYWFAVANRHHVFLYFHAGQTPFDGRTTSRYLMTGLVASGAVLVLYTVGNWLLAAGLGRRRAAYAPPGWRPVWALCAAPAAISIVLITSTQNQPVLPLPLAGACAGTTLAGLAFALAPAGLAVRAPVRLLWLGLLSLGLIPCLLLLRAVELPALGLGSAPGAYMLAAGSTLAGAAWLLGLSSLLKRRGQPAFGGREIFSAGLCTSYLLLPLLHYLLLAPPAYRYITVADNFFAVHLPVQLFCLAVAAGLAGLAGQWQRRR